MKEQSYELKEITPKERDYSQWYVDVVTKADLMDYAPVKGCMVIKPYGYSIWEMIQEQLDRRFKETGHVNAYFPMFIPESFLRKEAEHVEGFAPEVAWVTHGGGEELSERLAVRPTSETMICSMYSKWIQSWRDLPVLINQWCNIVRWEKATRPFLRTTEFLWQEGHTAHRTEEEAEEEALKMLGLYREFLEDVMAVPVIIGRKSESEKFAGALRTYTVEALMGDGKALQAGTSHNLGQHFAKAFDIMFLDSDGLLKYVWQTSWGVTTRLIGALVMVHGDNRGLRLPPKLAPIQAVIVPIFSRRDREKVMAKAEFLREKLAQSLRVRLDEREGYTPGWKFSDWEMRGVPLRIEVGPRDVQSNQAVLVRRDTGEKTCVNDDELAERVVELLDEIQSSMLAQAREFLEENTRVVRTFEEFEEKIEKRGFLVAGWCGSGDCEKEIKERTGATLRCIPFDQPVSLSECVLCGGKSIYTVYFARSY